MKVFFNTYDITSVLPSLHRRDRTLDMYFSNIPGAFRSLCRPLLGRSDHNGSHLVSKYRQRLKQEKPRIQCVCVWDHDSSEELRECFDSTDWQVFFDSCDNYEELADTATSYVQFCENAVIKSRDLRIFPPWLNKQPKHVLTGKKMAFLDKDVTKVN